MKDISKFLCEIFMPEDLQCEIHSFLLNIIYIYSIANVDPFNTEMFLPIKFDLVKR